MKSHILRGVALLCLAGLCFAAPQFPRLSGRVVDNAGLLSKGTKAQITQLLAEHERATTNQIVVATVPDLQGTTIEEYGYQLGRHWGIGQKDKNNGVILLVAKSERKVRIEVGYGLEGTLTDALSANIIQTQITPYFRKGEFDRGVYNGVKAIIAAIGGEYQAKPVKKSSKSSLWFLIILFLIFWSFIRSFIPFGGRRNYYGGYYGGGGFGGGGFGGGGFSGGGGGFGGGGASGGW